MIVTNCTSKIGGSFVVASKTEYQKLYITFKHDDNWLYLKNWMEFCCLSLRLDIWNFQFSSVHFNPLTDWVIRGTWGMIQQISSSSLFCRRPLWADLAWAGISTLWHCPHSISSADHGITHPQRCPDGCFWRGCCVVETLQHMKGGKAQNTGWFWTNGI